MPVQHILPRFLFSWPSLSAYDDTMLCWWMLLSADKTIKRQLFLNVRSTFRRICFYISPNLSRSAKKSVLTLSTSLFRYLSFFSVFFFLYPPSCVQWSLWLEGPLVLFPCQNQSILSLWTSSTDAAPVVCLCISLRKCRFAIHFTMSFTRHLHLHGRLSSRNDYAEYEVVSVLFTLVDLPKQLYSFTPGGQSVHPADQWRWRNHCPLQLLVDSELRSVTSPWMAPGCQTPRLSQVILAGMPPANRATFIIWVFITWSTTWKVAVNYTTWVQRTLVPNFHIMKLRQLDET